MSDPFAAMFARHLADDADDPPRSKLAPDIEVIRLRDSLVQFEQGHEFRVGMIVRQKPQVMQYFTHGDNGLGIVVEILSDPIYNVSDDSSSPYYRDKYDIVVGYIKQLNGGDTFFRYHVDSRCFEPVSEAEIASMTRRAADATE